jgi:hypothetical protein
MGAIDDFVIPKVFNKPHSVNHIDPHLLQISIEAETDQRLITQLQNITAGKNSDHPAQYTIEVALVRYKVRRNNLIAQHTFIAQALQSEFRDLIGIINQYTSLPITENAPVELVLPSTATTAPTKVTTHNEQAPS